MGKYKLVIFITVQTTTVNFQIQKINRSSRGRCYVKKVILKIKRKFQSKTSVLESLVV